MKITHVIRGDDHLSNTPKQVQCYRALGYPPPVFAHIPLILGPDRNRLSKRHGATSVQAFRDAGIVREALFNYLARLGWSHGDQEVFSREEVAEHFDLAHVGLAAAVFDRAKLEWLSQHWIKTLPAADLAKRLAPFLERAGLPAPREGAWLARVVTTLQERAKTLVEMAEAAAFYFRPPAAYEPAAVAKFWTPEAPGRYARLVKRLEGHGDTDPAALEALYRGLAAEMGLKLVDIAQLTRIALTGRAASPPIFEIIGILGKDETLRRLRAAQAAAEARGGRP
jgi:glutamyl-tRNA synthetase